MKKLIIALISTMFCTMILAAENANNKDVNEQEPSYRKIALITSVGTGIDLSRPSYTPFEWQVMCNYRFGVHWQAGVGTGVWLYDKSLIPVFGNLRIDVARNVRFMPFVWINGGYGLAPSDEANGGMYLHTAGGVKYEINKKMKIFATAGYEQQRLERLKTYSNSMISTTFSEELRHQLISLKIGVEF